MSKVGPSTWFCILVVLSQASSVTGILFSLWLLFQAPHATATDDPRLGSLYLARVAVFVGSIWYGGMIVILTCRMSCQKGMCCSGLDLLAYINSYTSGLNAMLALGVQIAYVGVGDFATSEDPLSRYLEIWSIGCVVGDLLFGSLISFIEDWNDDSKSPYKEMFVEDHEDQ